MPATGVQPRFKFRCVRTTRGQTSWQEVVVSDVGVWYELALIGAAVLVMGMVCALESWSG